MATFYSQDWRVAYSTCETDSSFCVTIWAYTAHFVSFWSPFLMGPIIEEKKKTIPGLAVLRFFGLWLRDRTEINKHSQLSKKCDRRSMHPTKLCLKIAYYVTEAIFIFFAGWEKDAMISAPFIVLCQTDTYAIYNTYILGRRCNAINGFCLPTQYWGYK